MISLSCRRLLSLAVVASGLLLAACSGSDMVYTRVTSQAPAGSGSTAFTLQNRDQTMHLTFPQNWEVMHVETQKGAEPGDDLIIHASPRAGFGISVSVPTFPDGDPGADWQYSVLDGLRESLKSKAPDQYTWVDATWTTVTGDPALQTTVVLKDGTRARDVYFFYNKLLLTASFVADDAGFEQLWPVAEQALKAMRFE